MDIVVLEPWLGGSHRAFLDAWQRHSSWTLDVVGLPARHWKWRMEGSAWALAQELRGRTQVPDAIVASDYVDLARLKGFLATEWSRVPALVYMHENQLTYPVAPGTPALERDLTHGMSNIMSCLAADHVVFNSHYHLDAFREAADDLLARLPKPRPRTELAARLGAASVVTPGVEFEDIPLGPGGTGRLRVLFNHRFEHDKAPETFLRSAQIAIERGAEMTLVLVGERFEGQDADVTALLTQLAPHIEDHGYVSRDRYAQLLGASDIVVSTARHEFFGIAVVEAIGAGCLPLVPRRLAYPEVIPARWHAECLYDTPSDLSARIIESSRNPEIQREEERRSTRRDGITHLDASDAAEHLDAKLLGLVSVNLRRR